MWNDIWGKYISDWTTHSTADIVAQILCVLIILTIGIFAIKVVGKKSINTLTIPNILFIFVLSSTLGALITKPYRIFIGMMVVFVITLFIFIIEKLIVKSNFLEQFLIHEPVILYSDGTYHEKNIRKSKMTIDQIESWIRVQGIPTLDAVKTIAIEFGGNLSFEKKSDYEPIKKMQFDDAMQQIMTALDSKYKEFQSPEINNLFTEIKEHKNKHQEKKNLQ